jgi:integration host factor subunit beta
MTRAELIEQMALRKNDMNPKIIDFVVKRIIEFMVGSFVNGQRMEVRGFGSFRLRKRERREARNPKTGELVITDEKYVLYFKPGKSLRERVNQKGLSKQAQELAFLEG